MMRYGELPTSPVVFAAADSKYFLEHAGPLVYSCDEQHLDVHLHVVNPTDEVLSYAAILASTVSVRVTYTFNDEDLSSVGGDALRAYYASLRFAVAPMILQHAGKILIVDIDCLVVNKLTFPDQPVGYFPREPLPGTVGWEQEGTKVAAGAVYFDREALNVCSAVAETLSGLPLRWFNDQIALSHVMNQVPEQFVHKFDSDFMDWEFRAGTTIWTGKGPRKHDNPVYVAEKHKYDRASDFIDYAQTVILAPRLDLMFKRNGLDVAKKTIEPIREHWLSFVAKLSQEEGEQNSVIIITAPRWFFNKTISDEYFPKATVYVPHVEKSYWGGGDNCRYYMQTVFPWLFTIDPIGWAGGSEYKRLFDPKLNYNGTAFEQMQEYIQAGNTKFKHIQGHREWNPDFEYIFVPLQLPHDETIKYHSDITVPEFVKSLSEWADNTKKIKIVFKGHPINLQSMVPLMEIIEQYENVHYVHDINIADGIKQAKAVYVINSGTGQESMLHEKPVVTFGKCDYEAATINGSIENLDQVYESVINDDHAARIDLYRRWFSWFINEVAYDSRI